MEPLTEPQRRVLEATLTRAQKIVLRMIRDKPNITRTELNNGAGLGNRTIVHSLRELRDRNLVKRIPHLADMRKVTYVAT